MPPRTKKRMEPIVVPLSDTPLPALMPDLLVLEEASCGNCDHWLRKMFKDDSNELEVSDYGFCRRYPPSRIDVKDLTPIGPCVTFNVTHHTQLCGEHSR